VRPRRRRRSRRRWGYVPPLGAARGWPPDGLPCMHALTSAPRAARGLPLMACLACKCSPRRRVPTGTYRPSELHTAPTVHTAPTAAARRPCCHPSAGLLLGRSRRRPALK
jgi:hypothetical protein